MIDGVPMSSEKPHFSDLQEIDEEHSAIRAIMRWIEAELARQAESPGGIRGDGPLLGPLRSFRDHLDRHFEFEERSGVLPAAIALRPEGSPTLEEWKQQHRDLQLQLNRAIRLLEQAAKTSAALAESFEAELRRVFADLREHDKLENRLLGMRRSPEFRGKQQDFEKRV